ncbi:hypothetical protein ACO1PK_07730 [Alishewanella sp. d11]|uniref:hypothetical protein n=1 Tax=Alishewanella sp. d11 TaxID=3414030 RepID=UPI003BF901D6
MQIQSAFNAGMQGLQRASAGITEETININRQTQLNRQQEQDFAVQAETQASPTPPPAAAPVQDVTQSLVRLEQQQLQAQANVRSLRTADEMLGSIIDVRV